jgi:YVTN family beta-propeller protein
MNPIIVRACKATVIAGVLVTAALASEGAASASGPGAPPVPPETAYVANYDSGTVTPIAVYTNTPEQSIKVGKHPSAIVITPNGLRGYVLTARGVVPFGTLSGKAGKVIKVGIFPTAMAITPNGKTLYVVNFGSDTVTPITVATNKPGKAIPVGLTPDAIAITPNGKEAYVVNFGSNTVTPIGTATNKAGHAINVGAGPQMIAISPNGRLAYVANSYSSNVTPIETATNTAGRAIRAGTAPMAVAFTPNGKQAYVVNDTDLDGKGPNYLNGTVTPIRVATGKASKAIEVGLPTNIAITSNGQTAYVGVGSPNAVKHDAVGYVIPINTATNRREKAIKIKEGVTLVKRVPFGKLYVLNADANTVTPVRTATNHVGEPIQVGQFPVAIAIGN